MIQMGNSWLMVTQQTILRKKKNLEYQATLLHDLDRQLSSGCFFVDASQVASLYAASLCELKQLP